MRFQSVWKHVDNSSMVNESLRFRFYFCNGTRFLYKLADEKSQASAEIERKYYKSACGQRAMLRSILHFFNKIHRKMKIVATFFVIQAVDAAYRFEYLILLHSKCYIWTDFISDISATL